MSIFLNENSKVIVQGMTGSEGRKHTQRMLNSGTAIVGGTNPKKAGQTVEWRNRSIEPHTVTGMGFDSGVLKPGQVFRHTFSAAGRYDYVCKPHHGLGMTGTVVVS